MAANLTDDEIAAHCDTLNRWGPSEDFYLKYVMSATSVLDVGCGTGRILHHARESGHVGLLRGLDPSPAMLARARRRNDIEWIAGYAVRAARWDRAFDLAIMTGHAFQCLLDDDVLNESLSAIRTALTVDGRFVFETRHPAARAWTAWNPEHATEFVDPAGVTIRVEHHVIDVSGEFVEFTETHIADGRTARVDRDRLRFLGSDRLAVALEAAGFAIDEQFGGWDGSPLTDAGPEIITVARRADPNPVVPER